MATLGLGFVVSANATKLASGANAAVSALDKIGNAASRTSRDVSMLKNLEIGKLIAGGLNAAASTVSSAARQMGSYAVSVASAVDATNDLSQRTGIGVEALQSMQVAAKLGGVDDATVAFQKMGVSIGKAIDNGDASDFEKIGLNFQELAVMAPEDQFRAIAAAISAVPGEASKAAAAVAIFGRSGAELLPFLANLGAVEERAKKLGMVLSEKQVGNIAGMNDALDLASKTFDGITAQVVSNLAPAVTSMAEEFLSFVESFNGEGGSGLASAVTAALFDGADMLAAVFDRFAGQFVDWLASFGTFETALETTSGTFSAVGNVITVVSETLRGLFNAFELVGNSIIGGLGMAIESIGWALGSDKAEQFGKDLAIAANANFEKNLAERSSATDNADKAANDLIFGGTSAAGGPGPGSRAVGAMRDAFGSKEDPAVRAQREGQAKLDRQQALLTKQMANAQAKLNKDAEKRTKDEEASRKKATDDEARMNGALEKAGGFKGDNAALLDTKSSAALQANDIRTSEGISGYLALATGREDPALAEYRKQHAALMQLVQEQRQQRTANAEILGAAA